MGFLTILLAALLQEAAVEPVPAPTEPCDAFLDLRRLELGFSGGALAFGGDFESDPQAVGLLSLRAPLPWLSRRVLGFDCDILGFFVQAGLGSIDRDLEPAPAVPDDTLILGALGVDLSLVPEDAWCLRFQAGAGYVDFGDVDGVESGAGLLLGFQAGVALCEGVWITAQPQALLASDDQLYLLSAGLTFRF